MVHVGVMRDLVVPKYAKDTLFKAKISSIVAANKPKRSKKVINISESSEGEEDTAVVSEDDINHFRLDYIELKPDGKISDDDDDRLLTPYNAGSAECVLCSGLAQVCKNC